VLFFSEGALLRIFCRPRHATETDVASFEFSPIFDTSVALSFLRLAPPSIVKPVLAKPTTQYPHDLLFFSQKSVPSSLACFLVFRFLFLDAEEFRGHAVSLVQPYLFIFRGSGLFSSGTYREVTLPSPRAILQISCPSNLLDNQKLVRSTPLSGGPSASSSFLAPP